MNRIGPCMESKVFVLILHHQNPKNGQGRQIKKIYDIKRAAFRMASKVLFEHHNPT